MVGWHTSCTQQWMPATANLLPSRSHAHVRAYGFVALSVVCVTLLRLPLEPFLHRRAPYAFYYLPILWAAWYGGVGPTIAAIALSLVSSWGFIVPGLESGYRATIGLFLVVSASMVVMARTARANQDAQFFLASIVESSDDAIVTKNLDGVIQSWNAGAQRIFGYAAHEIVGRSVLVLIPPELHDEEAQILERLRRGDRSLGHEPYHLRQATARRP